MIQLNPPLHMQTSKGSGYAHFVIDYGPEAELLFVVFLDEGGACWAERQKEVRLTDNYSLGRLRDE